MSVIERFRDGLNGISAVRVGLNRNSAPMKQLFLEVIRRSEEAITED